MTKLQAIRWFADYVAGEHTIIVRERSEWGMSLSAKNPRLVLPQDLMQNDEEDKNFRKFFISLCPMAQGFANVTISILHEMGHHFHRIEYITCDEHKYNNAYGLDHFNLPCERVATDWAVEWLQDKEHRKIAKQFEKDFFGVGQ